MNLHAEALPPDQQEALRKMGRVVAGYGFYLAGGTAVAVHLGHRQSVDLDWFTEQRLDEPMRLAKELEAQGVDLQVDSVTRGMLHAEADGVRVSFLEFVYPSLVPPFEWPSFNCHVASLDDLAAMKLLAVAQRGTKKDFLDVYALGMHGLSLTDMLAYYQKKFSTRDIARVTYSLSYFDDADPDPMPTMLADVDWDQVKETIRAWVKSMPD
jgi:hypothetical protein